MRPALNRGLFGKRPAANGGVKPLVHEAQYRCHDIRIVVLECAMGCRLRVHIFYEGKQIARVRENDQLYLDFLHARIAGLLHAFEIVDRSLTK